MNHGIFRGMFGAMGEARRIDEISSRQYGVFNTAQLREAGFDKDAVARRVANGSWLKLDHNVYCVASAPPKWERLVAAALMSRPGSVLTGLPAAFIHGLSGVKRSNPVLLVEPGANHRSALARLIECSNLDSVGHESKIGFELTTVAETIFFLSRDLRPPRLTNLVDEALLVGKMRVSQLQEIIRREDGRRTPGMTCLRRIIEFRADEAPAESSSYLERLLERVLGMGSIPSWHREHPFTINGRQARVDVVVPAWSLIVEADGRSWHMRDGDFDRDRQRDIELAGRGFQVLRFTYNMLKGDPEQCARQIETVGAVRSAQGRE